MANSFELTPPPIPATLLLKVLHGMGSGPVGVGIEAISVVSPFTYWGFGAANRRFSAQGALGSFVGYTFIS